MNIAGASHAFVPTADFNIHAVSTGPVDAAGRYVVRTVDVNLEASHRRGGFVLSATYAGRERLGTGIRWIQDSEQERAAAQAVHDAIHASGLLIAARASEHRMAPAHGMTRLYFDRRSSYVEFAIAQPPAAAQGILAALAGYAQIRATGSR